MIKEYNPIPTRFKQSKELERLHRIMQQIEDKRISTDIDPNDHSGEERFKELEESTHKAEVKSEKIK